MNLVGVRLTLLAGPKVPVPVAPFLLDSLESIEIEHGEESRAGFQMSFRVGRLGPIDVVDYPELLTPQLRPFSRVIVIVTFDFRPRVLLDGIITHQELLPGAAGETRAVFTGEDVSYLFDREEKSVEHPAQDETTIATKIIASYGLVPKVIPPPAFEVPNPVERTPVQQGTDLAYLNELAARFGYVFYVDPTPVPGVTIGYWGPPPRLGPLQSALSVNMGPDSNVMEISFARDETEAFLVEGVVLDRTTLESLPVQTFSSTRVPLSAMPSIVVNAADVRRRRFRGSGVTATSAFSRAQSMTDRSTDNVVTATGTIDSARYGDVLRPRELVGVRGVGLTYDGAYYVRRVSHRIRPGGYEQGFTLAREGVVSSLPVVVP